MRAATERGNRIRDNLSTFSSSRFAFPTSTVDLTSGQELPPTFHYALGTRVASAR